MSQQEMRQAIESGVPDPFRFMHPLMVKNYGQWDWHERPRPGVLHHMSKNGDEIWMWNSNAVQVDKVVTLAELLPYHDGWKKIEPL